MFTESNTSNTVNWYDLSVIKRSTLSPILFDIYVNYLPRATNMRTSLLADDRSALARAKKVLELMDSGNGK